VIKVMVVEVVKVQLQQLSVVQVQDVEVGKGRVDGAG
jgi:hypothetical protein